MSILTFLALIFLVLFAVLLLLKKKLAPREHTIASAPEVPVVSAESEMIARMARTVEKTEIETVKNDEYTATHITHDASHIHNLPIEVKEEDK